MMRKERMGKKAQTEASTYNILYWVLIIIGAVIILGIISSVAGIVRF